MSRNRFILIVRAFHFCINPEAGKKAPSRKYKVEKV